jgi:hypothetical protein
MLDNFTKRISGMKLLKSQLKTIKHLETRINPDREWVLHTREKIMTQIAHTSNQTASDTLRTAPVAHSISTWAKIFVPQSFVQSFKPVFSVFAALLITSVGWIASAYAQPGDVFWGAKNAMSSVIETGRLVLATDDEQASLKLTYASKQAHLLKQVVETDNVAAEKKARLVEKTMTTFQKKLDSAQESIKTLPASDAAEMVKEVSLSTRDISETLKEAATVAEKNDTTLSEKIEKTASDVAKQGLEMVGDTVAKKGEANLVISPEEEIIVKEHIDSAVESILADAMKVHEKLTIQSGATSSSVGTATSSMSSISIVSSTLTTSSEVVVSSNEGTVSNALNTVTVITEQKKTVDSLKETNLLEAINTTKILAEQVSVIIGNTASIITEIPKTPTPTVTPTTKPLMTTPSTTTSSSTSISTTTPTSSTSLPTSTPTSP